MKAQAVICFKFPSKKHLNTVLKVLKPEAERPTSARSRVRIRGKGSNLSLEFEARDTSALRAAINSYLYWISLSIETFSKLNNLAKPKKI